jgi:hypothetical protein
VQLDTGQVLLKHGAVPGYMDAMTMPFQVADRASILQRRPETCDCDPRRRAHPRLPRERQAMAPPSAGGRRRAARRRRVHVLAPGDPVPTVAPHQPASGQPALTRRLDGGGGRRDLHLHARPLPDFCLLMDARFAEIQALAAAEAALAGKVRLPGELRPGQRHPGGAHGARGQAGANRAGVSPRPRPPLWTASPPNSA